MMQPLKTLLTVLLLTVSTFAVAKERVLDIQTWTTNQGSQVFFVETEQLPMVDIVVAFNAGSARDESHAGLANLTNIMLDQSAGDMSASDIAQKFDQSGAIYSSSINRDMAVVSVRSLSGDEYLMPTLNVFATVISQPTFDARSFQREQQRQLAGIEQDKQYPSTIASQAFFAALYPDEPYAKPISGTEDSVVKLTPNLLQDFHQRYYVASNAVITIVGNVNKEKANSIAETISMQLKAGEPAPQLTTAQNSSGSFERISFPATQTTILLGQVGISHHTDDYFPLIVGNYSFGGGPFISRLYNEVREKRGLAYSVYSQFLPLAARGPFVINLSTENQQAKDALDVVEANLNDFLDNGPTVEELQRAKDFLIGNFALQLDSNSAIASIVSRMGFYQLPLDYLDTYQANIADVTLEQVKQAFQQHIKTGNMVTVLVGENTSDSQNG